MKMMAESEISGSARFAESVPRIFLILPLFRLENI